MPSKFNFDILRKFLPEKTFELLNAPPKDELADLGQRELPFPEEVDFLPAAAVEAENFGAAQSEAREGDGYFESLFGPPRRQLQIPGLEAGLTSQFTSRPQSQVPTGPLWDTNPNTDQIAAAGQLPPEVRQATAAKQLTEATSIPSVGMPPPEMVDKLSGSEYKTIYGEADPVVLTAEAGAPEASPWMSEGRYRQKPLEAAARVPGDRTSFLEDPSAFRADPMEVAARMPKKPVSLLADPELEKAVHYGQDTGALPAGRYEEYPLPGGRGAKFVPQSPSSAYGAIPEPGIAMPSLSETKRGLEDLTGEGVAQNLSQSNVPFSPRAEVFVRGLEERGGIDRSEIQPIWDRISSNYAGNPQGAEREFAKFASAVLKAGKDPVAIGNPIRRMQAAFTQAGSIARANSNEGFGERGMTTNNADIAQQLSDAGDSGMPQGFRGSELDANARQDFDPTSRTLDVEEKFAIGQRPLSAITRKPGLTDDPVENFLKGSSDMAVLPKGTLGVGPQRVQGKGLPSEVEVVKVIPLSLSSKPGYLKAISKRSGIPLRNLQLMVDAGQELDIVQVKRPSGKVGKELPPEGRWRNPEDLKFWASDKGESQKARFDADPEMTEKILQAPSARVVRAEQGAGKDVLAVVKRDGKDFAVVEKDGKKILRSLMAGEKGPTYNGKALPSNLIEKDPLRGEMPKPGVLGGVDPRDAATGRTSEGEIIPRAQLSERLASETYSEKGPTQVEGLTLSPTPVRDDFSGVKFALSKGPKVTTAGGSAVIPPVAKNAANAELTLVFTPREKPSPLGKEFQDYKAGQREMVNPSVDDIRDVLSRSEISKVAVKVEEGSRRGPAAGTWERVKAILKEVKKPSGKGRALAGAGAAVAASLFGAEEAEAAPRTGKASFELSAPLRDAVEPPTGHEGSFAQQKYAQFIDQFEPVYRGLRELLGKDDTPLREIIQTNYGGSGGDTEISNEPTKLAYDRMKKAGLEPQFNRLLTTRAGLRQWDIVAHKRDAYLAEALALRTSGRMDDSRKAQRVADSLNSAISGKTIWEQNLSKEDLSSHMAELQAEVGPDGMAKMERELPAVYGAVQAKLDEFLAEGLLDPISYREYKARGIDYVPTWKTPWELDENGQTLYTGSSLEERHPGSTLQLNEETIIQEVMGSIKVMKDPLDNVASFIARGTQEIYRNRIAKGVVEEFGPGVAIRHKKPPVKAAIGNGFYHFMENGQRVTYEMPAYLVEPLLLVDKRASDAILQALPGNKTLGTLRSIAEAGVTTGNIGFGAAQMAFDPITALIQVPWGKKIPKVLLPFTKRFFQQFLAGTKREWISGTESTDLRKRAGKAGALGSGATSQILDPKDLMGNKGMVRANQAKDRGDYAGAVKETVNYGLSGVARRLMKPIEEATKLATYGTLQELNPEMSDRTAAYLTRTKGGSPDWAQGGNGDAYLRWLIAFGRPALLGTDIAIQSAQKDPKKIGALMAGVMASELARQTFNQMTVDQTGESMEDLEKHYSHFDNDNTFLVMIPPDLAEKLPGLGGKRLEVLANGTERPFALKLPLPPILRLYSSPFRGVAKAYSSGNLIEAPLAVADEMIPGSVPFEADNLGVSAKNRVGAALSTPLRAGLEQVTGTQFFTGADIEGSRIKDLPLNERYTETTSPTIKAMAKGFGNTPLLGSPARLEHLSKAFLPGVFQTPIQILDSLKPQKVAPVAKGELERLKGIPFLGPAFFNRIIPQSHSAEMGDLQDDFYGLAGQTKGAAGAVGKFEKGILDEPSKLVQLLGEANPDVSALVRELSQLSTAQKQIVNSPDLDSQEKRSEIKGIMDQKRSRLKEFLSDPTYQLLLRGEVPE